MVVVMTGLLIHPKYVPGVVDQQNSVQIVSESVVAEARGTVVPLTT